MNRATAVPSVQAGANDHTATHPLTEAQEGLWYAQRLDPGNPLFNTGLVADIRGPLDRAAFRAAVDQTMREADALALALSQGQDGPSQRIAEARRPRLELADLSGGADPRAAALAMIQTDVAGTADPLFGPLAATKLFVLGPGHHLWYLRAHHLAVDGYGTALLLRRVGELYDSIAAGTAPGLGFGRLAAVFDEDAGYRRSAQRGTDAAYWRTCLADLPDVVGMTPGRAVSAQRFDRTTVALGAELAGRLRARAAAAGMPWPDLLAAFTAAYCRRFSSTPEIVVGVPFMGRLGSAAARVPAMVMNVLPLRVAVPDDAPADDFLKTVAQALVRGRRHGRYRGEQMRRDLGLLGGQRRLFGPLINVLPFDVPLRLSGVEVTTTVLNTGPVDDITFTFRGDGADEIRLEVDTNPDLYTAAEGAAHASRLVAFLEQAVAAASLADVPTASPDEERRFAATLDATAHPVPATTLAALIEAGFAATPDAVALVAGAVTWSYAELERRTRALALQLRSRGVGCEDIVAVALPRSAELVVALIAILRAGAAYLPLDPEHPPERNRRILASACPNLVLASGDFAVATGSTAPLLRPADWHADPGAEPIPGPPPSPENLAYVIYTSGSTGEPKGAMIEHRAIVNRLEWMRRHYGFSASDRVLQKTPATFDVSVWEFFLPFISGGSLVVAPPGAHRDPRAIAGLIRGHGVTTAHFVPSMLSVFLAEPTAQGLSLARVFCSGEELTADLAARFHATVTAELHNLYGPTEAAVDISYWPVPAQERSRPVPIGVPVWNSRLYVLDDHLRPVPPGITGHLHLAGVQLARGYLGRDDLTAERFVPDPFVPGERMYRTGDLARRRPDGAVIYAGRSDHQVKIRGLRIELGEIEAAMRASGLVRDAVVLAREDRVGHRQLVAYPVPGAGYSDAAIRSRLAASLPDYMVPAAFVALDELPVTANGKLDRGRLPAPDFAAPVGRPPVTQTERTVARLYAEVLGLTDAPGADADFFSLGGDSLLAVSLMLPVAEVFGRDPGLGALFASPEVGALARLIDAEAPTVDNGLQPLIRLASGDPDLPPLFVVHPVGGIAWCYRHLARMLSPRRTVYGLQAPALSPGVALPADLAALAADYAARIRTAVPRGPYHVAGWSVGGIIAQAVAVHLADTGSEPGVVALLDSYPADCWRAEAEPTPVEAMRALLAVAGHVPEDHPELVTRADIVAFLKRESSPLAALPDAAFEGVIRVVLDINRLVRGHFHRRYTGTLTHFRAAHDHKDTGLTPDLWRPYAAELDEVSLPFLHRKMAGAAASALVARALERRLAAREAGGG